jgi:hypothetical protein
MIGAISVVIGVLVVGVGTFLSPLVARKSEIRRLLWMSVARSARFFGVDVGGANFGPS